MKAVTVCIKLPNTWHSIRLCGLDMAIGFFGSFALRPEARAIYSGEKERQHSDREQTSKNTKLRHQPHKRNPYEWLLTQLQSKNGFALWPILEFFVHKLDSPNTNSH